MTRTTRWSLIGIALMVFVAVLMLGWFSYVRGQAQKQLDALRADGYPTSMAELDAWYPAPTGKNAAETYIEGMSRLVKPETALASFVTDAQPKPWNELPVLGTVTVDLFTGELDARTIELMTAYLDANAEALARLDAGAQIAEAKYPMPREVFGTLEWLSEMRSAASTLVLRAALQTERGDLDGAVTSLVNTMAFGRSREDSPMLIDHLVVVAIKALAAQNMARLAQRQPLTDAQLQRLIKALVEAEDFDGLERGFIGEVAGLNPVLADSQAMAALGFNFGALHRLYLFTGLNHLDRADYIRLMRGYIAAAKLPYAQRAAAGAAVVRDFESLPRYRLVIRQLFPALERAAVISNRMVADLLTTAAGLAVMRYKLAEGKLPAKLADIAPRCIDPLPEDPFTGKPLVYKTRPDGSTVVYSTGEDATDDGGAKLNSKGKQYDPGSDIVFAITPPTKAQSE
jgi:hypothetical protein